MRKSTLIICSIFLLSQVAVSQVKFDTKSGKIKAKVAKKEAREAKNDEAFQSLMNEGHDLFSQHDFEGAIAKYESAADRRPINVYPRVKIADVRLAMINFVPEEPKAEEKKYEISKAEAANDLASQADRVKEALKKEEDKIKVGIPPPPKDTVIDQPKIVTQKVDPENIEILTPEDFAIKLAQEYPEGVTEENWEEARKKMTRRVVVKNGKGNDYRRVVAVYATTYFKNDHPITKHTWDTETVLEP